MRKHTRPSLPRPSTSAAIPQRATRQAVFDKCHHFTVTGGTFNIPARTNGNEADESDFLNIKLGHLKLLAEIAKQNIVEYRDVRHKGTGVVKHRVPEVIGVRRIHHARVIGMREDFTAIVYQGSEFVKHYAHAEKREEFRHPALVQLFSVTSSTRLNALIYNDELIPLNEFRKMHQQSLLGSALLEYEIGRHFHAALDHWLGITGELLLVCDSNGFLSGVELGTILWIRIATGQLCIEVDDNKEQNHTRRPLLLKVDPISSGLHPTLDTNFEENLLSNLSLDDIHHIFVISGQLHAIEISEPGTILLGSLSWPTPTCPHLFNPFSKLSVSVHGLGLPDVDVEGWQCGDSYTWGSLCLNNGLVVLPNGWTRILLADFPINRECQLTKNMVLIWEAIRENRKIWLAQANHVMDKSGVDADELFIIDYISLRCLISSSVDDFTLEGTFMAECLPDYVYLFLFPAEVDDSDGNLTVHLPSESERYYWSCDPEGIEHLPQEALDNLSLPCVSFRAEVCGTSWRKEIYNSIGKFHHAKGYDPVSQDVAIKLGYPLVDVERLNNLINGDKIEEVDEVEGQGDGI